MRYLLNVSIVDVRKKSTTNRNSLVAESTRCFRIERYSTSYGNLCPSAVATCTSIGSFST